MERIKPTKIEIDYSNIEPNNIPSRYYSQHLSFWHSYQQNCVVTIKLEASSKALNIFYLFLYTILKLQLKFIIYDLTTWMKMICLLILWCWSCWSKGCLPEPSLIHQQLQRDFISIIIWKNLSVFSYWLFCYLIIYIYWQRSVSNMKHIVLNWSLRKKYNISSLSDFRTISADDKESFLAHQFSIDRIII